MKYGWEIVLSNFSPVVKYDLIDTRTNWTHGTHPRLSLDAQEWSYNSIGYSGNIGDFMKLTVI